jgi:hypothetical protein
MQAIEFPVEIDANQQIHLQLPAAVHARKAKVIVMYEDAEEALVPIKLGLFKGKIAMVADFNEPLAESFWLEGKP